MPRFRQRLTAECPGNGAVYLPDATVVCGELRFSDDRRDTLVNPQVIVEVLSPSTQEYDRGVKFEHYKSFDSFTDYLLVEQDMRDVEHWSRSSDGAWRKSESAGSDIVRLSSIACELPLDEIYDKVELSD